MYFMKVNSMGSSQFVENSFASEIMLRYQEFMTIIYLEPKYLSPNLLFTLISQFRDTQDVPQQDLSAMFMTVGTCSEGGRGGSY